MKLGNKIAVLIFVLCYSLGIKAQIRWTIQDYPTVSSLKSETLVPRATDKVFVKSQNSLFVWDSSSIEEEDTLIGGVIKQATINIGRWRKTGSKTISIKLITNQSSSSTTRTNMTDFAFNAVANKRYKVEILGGFQSNTLTTGLSIGFVTSGTGSVIGRVSIPVSQSFAATEQAGTIRAISGSSTLAGSFVTSTGVNPVNSPHVFSGNLIYDSTASGIFRIQFGSEIDGSIVTILSNTTLIITQLN